MDLISREALRRKVQKVAVEAWKLKMTASVETVMNQFLDFLEQSPSVPAVPLDKLCEYLNSVIYPCIICKEIPGPQCNAKRKGCWERVLTKWMEEQDATD